MFLPQYLNELHKRICWLLYSRIVTQENLLMKLIQEPNVTELSKGGMLFSNFFVFFFVPLHFPQFDKLTEIQFAPKFSLKVLIFTTHKWKMFLRGTVNITKYSSILDYNYLILNMWYLFDNPKKQKLTQTCLSKILFHKTRNFVFQFFFLHQMSREKS